MLPEHISSNNIGTSQPEIKNGYITVFAAPTTNTLTESFESITFPNSIWSLQNTSITNTNWQIMPRSMLKEPPWVNQKGMYYIDAEWTRPHLYKMLEEIRRHL